jgi:uncharacterized protein (DUF58 family)
MPAVRSRFPTRLSKSGWMLILLSLMVGAAAFNSANNVLFLAFSLLLSSLLLNGLLSWWNFSRIEAFRLWVPHARAGENSRIEFHLRDRKRLLPSLGMQAIFEITDPLGQSTTLTLVMSPVEYPLMESVFPLRWIPSKRGLHQVELLHLGSSFPFGFIYKTYPLHLKTECAAWPRRTRPPIDRPKGPGFRHETLGGPQKKGRDDFHGIQPYSRGTSPALIHWKKSAQTGELLIKELHEATQPVLHVQFDLHQTHFPNESAFDHHCEKIAAWAEDQLRKNRKLILRLHNHPPITVVPEQLPPRILLDTLARITPQTQTFSPTRGMGLIQPPDWQQPHPTSHP